MLIDFHYMLIDFHYLLIGFHYMLIGFHYMLIGFHWLSFLCVFYLKMKKEMYGITKLTYVLYFILYYLYTTTCTQFLSYKGFSYTSSHFQNHCY